MEVELLKELDSLLNPAIGNAWLSAERMSRFGGDPRTPFLDMLKIELDHTKVDLSKTMYKLDMAMQGQSTDVERAAAELVDIFPPDVNELPDVNERDYVKSTKNGFEVWDGSIWVQLSKDANIKVEIFENPENENKPAVRVWAQDDKTGSGVRYLDNDISAPGRDTGQSWSDFGDEGDVVINNRSHYWEDPFYNMAKNGNSVGGLTAGVLEMRHVGNMTPWRTGNAFRNADGWYRNAERIYENLFKQRGLGAGGFQKSANRALDKANIFKGAGKVFFAAGMLISGYDAGHAYATQDINRKEIYTKASVDVLIGVIGTFGGPIGWVIAGSYFLLDVSGAFGDWGRPSGISQNVYNRHLIHEVQNTHGAHIQSLKFEVDYITPIEQLEQELNLEDRSVKKDNTIVAMPKVLFSKD